MGQVLIICQEKQNYSKYLCHKAESKRFQPYFFAQIHPNLPK
jgi:hypothetical protein